MSIHVCIIGKYKVKAGGKTWPEQKGSLWERNTCVCRILIWEPEKSSTFMQQQKHKRDSLIVEEEEEEEKRGDVPNSRLCKKVKKT